jgi:glycosyltransferase involved in cell wall biosynthesis
MHAPGRAAAGEFAGDDGSTSFRQLMAITESSGKAANVRLNERPGMRGGRGPGLLCVANFPANTGYAWDFIEGLYRSVAERLSAAGITTWVAYPHIGGPPATLEGSAARAVELDVGFDTPARLHAVLNFVRRHGIRVVYMADRAAWSPAYALLRLAGVRWIVVHDHTSGERTVPTGLRRLVKRHRHGLPGTLADRIVAVSDFVARRKVQVDQVPADRVVRIWNSIPVAAAESHARDRLRRFLGIGEDDSVVATACRATPEKGVAHLLRAFDRCCDASAQAQQPTLVYFGDGPEFEALKALRDSLPAASRIRLVGYREDAAALMAGADVCVVPSVWQEAFGLAALEPMTHALPVIASRAGGIPEIVVDRQTGILVDPGDEAGLTVALTRLLADPAERRRLGANGMQRAQEFFSPETTIRELLSVIEPGFAFARAGGSAA